jgi:CheY-like chemotaxis protein
MPGMTGYDLLQAIRESPVALHSADLRFYRFGLDDVLRALDMGAKAICPSPLTSPTC